MLTQDLLLQNKDSLELLVPTLDESDLALLIGWLHEKDDNIRYAAFLLLQILADADGRVYPYWDTFVAMLDDGNSYQRSLGLMLIANNIRWDKQDQFGKISQKYLEHCDDEKFVTARQCIQGLMRIVEYTRQYNQEIVAALCGIDLAPKKETQRGLLLLDIAEVLERICACARDRGSSDPDLHGRIQNYLRDQYELGNDKAKKKIRAMLGK